MADFLLDSGDEGYKIIRDHLVEIIVKILNENDNLGVSLKAVEALALITNYIMDVDKGPYILTKVICKNILLQILMITNSFIIRKAWHMMTQMKSLGYWLQRYLICLHL